MADPRLDNEARYDRMAPHYARLLRVASLGTISGHYRAVAAALDVPADGSVVEIGCGPATVTPHIRAAVGDGVRITGVDLSSQMIALARERAEREGWKNVTYEQSDVTVWRPQDLVDAVVFSLVLSGLPNPLGCVDRALAWLRPGGQIVVLDSFLVPGRGFANWVIRAKAPRLGVVPDDLPLDALLARLEGPQKTDFSAGIYSVVSGRVVSGRKPGTER